ncbi:SulP family inorganic anion transporter [Caldilinea sp.]|jgi:high affinity sulfate transporter 1|uniref:SulP family inorganic anion transporter n=1 Tax=Caldilinea sp. TaxID=2293560 RepID=UPI001B252BC8|nr:SulP family inorganic anion transporter [Caldilinea sp.]MBO9394101.1 SulP family inorganic anion transporter [Caldilinea sp.]
MGPSDASGLQQHHDAPSFYGWRWWAPGLSRLLAYSPAWLRYDLSAGLVLATMLVPVGMAYAQAAGLPAVHGLYATIVPLLAYAMFGPSRILVIGPDSSLAPIIAATVLPLAHGDAQRAVALAGMMAIMAGVVCIGAGIARLGFVTELLSKPIRYGYINGIALTVLVSQAPTLLGFSVEGGNALQRLWGLVEGITAGSINWVAFAIGGSALVTALLLKRWPRLPAMLIVLVGATLVVALFDLGARTGLAVLGEIPTGLPTPALPQVNFDDLAPLLLGGVTVAVVAFADTSVLSRAYAAKTGDKVDPNQELIALGAANLAAGFFQGFPISSSTSRTPVAEAAGARTQLAGVTGAVAVTLLLLFAPSLLSNTPTAVLAAIVMVSALSLIQVNDLKRIYRIQRWEFWLSMACLVGVVLFGAIQGVGLAIVIAVIEFLWDGWRPHSAVLGRVDGLKGYHDVTRYPHARLIPGLVLFRWDAPLFFANAEYFRTRVLEAIAASPTPVRWVVVAAEPVTSVDVTAADMLTELDNTLRQAGIQLYFAEMKDPVKDKLKRFGLFERFGEEHFFQTIGQAVNTYIKKFDIDWVDWEDRLLTKPSQMETSPK